jgi:hypothetical protein
MCKYVEPAESSRQHDTVSVIRRGRGLCNGRYSWLLRLGLHRDLAGRSHLQMGFQEPLAGIETGLLLALHDWLHEHPAFTTLALVYYFCASFTTTVMMAVKYRDKSGNVWAGREDSRSGCGRS